jgi:hypothetical protein
MLPADGQPSLGDGALSCCGAAVSGSSVMATSCAGMAGDASHGSASISADHRRRLFSMACRRVERNNGPPCGEGLAAGRELRPHKKPGLHKKIGHGSED